MLAEKYDISNKILNELSNLKSRHILFAIMKHPKSIMAISSEQKIPLSSVYKRIISLRECSMIHETVDFSKSGHKARYYQSKIKDIEISITEFEPEMRFTKNKLMKND